MEEEQKSNKIVKVKRVKKFQINRNSDAFKPLCEICTLSRNMYNYTLFILRQLNFATFPTNGNTSEYYLSRIPDEIKPFIEPTTVTVKNKANETVTRTYYHIRYVNPDNPSAKYSEEQSLFSILSKIKQRDFMSMQCTASRAAVKLALNTMTSYSRASLEYFKNPSKFNSHPQMPRYKKENELSVFAISNFSTNKKDGSIKINGNVKLDNVYVNCGDIVKQIRVVPEMSKDIFTIEVIYDKIIEVPSYVGSECMAIDIGINNIAAITMTNGKAMLINGKPLKNINHYFNKESAKLNTIYSKHNIKNGKKGKMLQRVRQNKIETFLHQTSRLVVDIAVGNGCGKIFIGHNKDWKKCVNLGKRNNQNFVQIPFNNFISMIRYKAEECGIQVEEINEAYTSKCSALDNEEICKHEQYKGKRKGRHNKTFITSKNILINADINGSLNILRLGIGNGYNIDTSNVSILTPPKFNKVGREKYDKMQPQNRCGEINDDMAYDEAALPNSHIKVKATVDSHNVDNINV